MRRAGGNRENRPMEASVLPVFPGCHLVRVIPSRRVARPNAMSALIWGGPAATGLSRRVQSCGARVAIGPMVPQAGIEPAQYPPLCRSFALPLSYCGICGRR